MPKSTRAAKDWVDSLVKLPAFADRCGKICEWAQLVYPAQKVLLFFHSKGRSRYTIHRTIGINRISLRSFDFHSEKFIHDGKDNKTGELPSGSMPLDDWTWTKRKLRDNLRKAGMQMILPFWSGSECLGGLILKKHARKTSPESKIFEESASDFGHLLEIAFVNLLLQRDEWEKKVLLGVGKRISELSDLGAVLNLMVDSIKEVIAYDSAGIFLLKMPEKSIEYSTLRGFPSNLADKVQLKVGKGIVGWSIENDEEVIVHDVRADKRYVMARKGSRSSLVMPIKFGNKVMGAIALESDKLHFFKYHDVELMRTFAAQTAIVLENSKLLYQAMEAAQLQKELEIAAGIQRALLPKSIPQKNGYDIAAVNKSSLAVGGDLYDFIQISDQELGVAIGDISGKGVPGALLMATLYATFRGMYLKNESPDRILKKLNRSLYQQTEPDKFSTFFYGILNYAEGTFTYSNAGHNPPIVVDKKGDWKLLKKGGALLGFVSDVNYQSGKITLSSGGIVFLYTDGVSETFDAQDNEFGEQRIIDALKEYRDQTAQSIIESITRDLKKFAKKGRQDDDITIVVIKKD